MALTSDQASVAGLVEPQNVLEKPAAARETKRKHEGQRQPGLECPRCGSTNTKFCYYNNYSRLQPRHFCKACRRHWTNGGTLRNVPVGGGRKNKRNKATKSTNISNTTVATGAIAAESNSRVDHANGFLSGMFGQVLLQNSQPLVSEHGAEMRFVNPSAAEEPFVFSSVLQHDSVVQEPMAAVNSSMPASEWRLPPATASTVECGFPGYWNCLDDEIARFVGAEIKMPMADDR